MRIGGGDLALKALSLGLALLLWLFIAGEKSSEMGLTVQLELQNFPKDLELTGDTVNQVEVRLRASPGIVQRIAPGDVSAQIDLAGAGEGESILHLTSETIRVPFGVTVVKITPAILTLNLEHTLQKQVPVRPRLLGSPAEGFEVSEVTSSPPTVLIAGPRSRVREVESAFTEPVSIQGAQTTVVEKVSLGLEDAMLRVLENPRVEVTARIRELYKTLAFKGLVVSVRGGDALARPREVEVILEGPASVISVAKRDQVHAWATLPPSGSGEAQVAVELLALSGVSVKEIRPARVTLHPVRRAR